MTKTKKPYTREDQQRGLRRLALVAGMVLGGAIGATGMNIMMYGGVPACM